MTVADLLKKLGGISPERVRLQPPLGTATEEDVLTIQARENRNCELVDGVLVENLRTSRQRCLPLRWVISFTDS